MGSTEQLADLIRRKHQLLGQLRDLGRRQTDLIACGDIGSLMTLLAAKQQLMSALQGVECNLKPYYAEDPERRVWRSAQDRAACAQQAADCNALLEQIVHLEKLGAEEMTDRRNEVAEQLKHVQAATQVRGAYEANRRSHV